MNSYHLLLLLKVYHEEVTMKDWNVGLQELMNKGFIYGDSTLEKPQTTEDGDNYVAALESMLNAISKG